MDNRLKTFLLLAVLTAVALGIGQLFGPTGFYIALFIVLVINVAMYFFSDKLALRMYRAQEVSEKQEPVLHRLVAEIAQKAHIPKPKVYIIPSVTPNAFATGRNPKHGVVAFTTGIMSLLTERELKGVIAHEIAHIKNRDILITTIAATVAGLISYLATMAQWMAILGGFDRDDGGSGMIQLLVMAILAPIIAIIIKMAVSRAREFYADKRGAEFINDPQALASALEKLERGVEQRPLQHGPQGGESLFIVNPFSGKSVMKWLSTHPPTEERVKKLRAMRI